MMFIPFVFKIRPDGGVPEFKAGQFLTMGIPDPVDPGREDIPKHHDPVLIEGLNRFIRQTAGFLAVHKPVTISGQRRIMC